MHATLRPLLALLLLAPVPAAAQDAVRFAARLDPDRPLRYQLDAEFSIRRSSAPDAPGVVLRQSAVLRLAPRTVNADGSARLLVSFDHLKIEQRLFTGKPEPGLSVWEWDGEGDPPAPGQGAPAPFRAYPLLARARAEVTLRPGARVVAFSGWDAAQNAADPSPEEPPLAAFLGLFTRAGAPVLLQAILSPDPDGPARRPGDQWTVTESLALPGPSDGRIETTYTYDAAEGATARISGRVVASILPSRVRPDPADPVVEIAGQSGAVSLVWDTRAARLVERTSARAIDWVARLQLREPLEVRDVTSSRVTIRLLDAP